MFRNCVSGNMCIKVAVVGLSVALPMMFLSPALAQESYELNIAVLPSWVPVLDQIAPKKQLGAATVNQMTLDLGKTRSDYEKIYKAFDAFEKHSTHVVIGPYDDAISMATEARNIPYIATTQVPSFRYLCHLNCTFEIIPSLDKFSQAIYDLVKKYKWDKVSIIFDDNKGISVVETLISNHELMIKSWRLDRETTEKQVRDHLVHMRRIFMQKSIVFCNKKNTKILLETARDLAMLSVPYIWLFYDPGDELPEVFRVFRHVHVNFTVFSMVQYDASDKGIRSYDNGYNLTLAHDSMSLLEKSVQQIYFNRTVEDIRKSIQKAIKTVQFEGYSGHVQFDENGQRDNFSIFLTECSGYDHFQIGHWLSKTEPFLPQLQLGVRLPYVNRTSQFPLVGRTAKVVSILEKPFCMYKRDHKVRAGNDRFEGFAVDLIAEVAQMLNFDYDIYLVHDDKFGNKMHDGNWNGMIGELLAGNATMSVSPLSINTEREGAIDFTKPFMIRYISVLMKVPRSTTSYFEFLNPLHPIVWFCTLGAFIFVSIVLYILERIGNVNRKEFPSISFRESFWFVFGSLLQGSTDASPTTLPGRILTSSWWFFALILISSYTANLAAFLTVKKINTPIKSVTDLSSQTKIKYGTVKDSGIMTFFKNTDIEHFSKMWAQMSEVDPESLVDDTEEGFKKVKAGNYAFFWDTTVNNYKTIQDCDYMEVGPPFDPKGFGIGVPPGATYRDELTMAILTLSDRGTLHELENKWWGRRDCPDFSKSSSDETSELQIQNVAGVFFILVGGIAVAAVTCLGEYVAMQISKNIKKKALVRGSFVAMDIVEALGRNSGDEDKETRENTESNTRKSSQMYSAFAYRDTDTSF